MFLLTLINTFILPFQLMKLIRKTYFRLNLFWKIDGIKEALEHVIVSINVYLKIPDRFLLNF